MHIVRFVVLATLLAAAAAAQTIEPSASSVLYDGNGKAIGPILGTLGDYAAGGIVRLNLRTAAPTTASIFLSVSRAEWKQDKPLGWTRDPIFFSETGCLGTALVHAGVEPSIGDVIAVVSGTGGLYLATAPIERRMNYVPFSARTEEGQCVNGSSLTSTRNWIVVQSTTSLSLFFREPFTIGDVTSKRRSVE